MSVKTSKLRLCTISLLSTLALFWIALPAMADQIGDTMDFASRSKITRYIFQYRAYVMEVQQLALTHPEQTIRPEDIHPNAMAALDVYAGVITNIENGVAERTSLQDLDGKFYQLRSGGSYIDSLTIVLPQLRAFILRRNRANHQHFYDASFDLVYTVAKGDCEAALDLTRHFEEKFLDIGPACRPLTKGQKFYLALKCLRLSSWNVNLGLQMWNMVMQKGMIELDHLYQGMLVRYHWNNIGDQSEMARARMNLVDNDVRMTQGEFVSWSQCMWVIENGRTSNQ